MTQKTNKFNLVVNEKRTSYYMSDLDINIFILLYNIDKTEVKEKLQNIINSNNIISNLSSNLDVRIKTNIEMKLKELHNIHNPKLFD